jgi:hypothetical protein
MMNELRWFTWLFPLLFIVHDMEEIMRAKQWCKKGLRQFIPLPITPFGNTNNTAAFSVGVFEELILWISATLLGNITGFYGLWYGLLAAIFFTWFYSTLSCCPYLTVITFLVK